MCLKRKKSTTSKLIASTAQYRNASNRLIQNAKGRVFLQINRHKVLLSYVYTQKRSFCVLGEVFVGLFILKCRNPNRLNARPMTILWTIKPLIEIWSAIINRKAITFQRNNARLHYAKEILEKINKLGCVKLLHPPDITPLDFHIFRSP